MRILDLRSDTVTMSSRMVTHKDMNRSDVDYALDVFKDTASECLNSVLKMC